MLNLFLKLFSHNPKLCTNYKHWIHNHNKKIKQFYININRASTLNLIWGGKTPTFNKM
jgi:hypothetical protein